MLLRHLSQFCLIRFAQIASYALRSSSRGHGARRNCDQPPAFSLLDGRDVVEAARDSLVIGQG
jgi:hypothetical protein